MIRVKALIYGRQMMRVNVITNILHCPPFSLPAGKSSMAPDEWRTFLVMEDSATATGREETV